MDCRNLRAEMVRNGISRKQVGEVVDLCQDSISSRFNGKTDFKLGELAKIRDTLFPGLSIDYLAGLTDERGL